MNFYKPLVPTLATLVMCGPIHVNGEVTTNTYGMVHPSTTVDFSSSFNSASSAAFSQKKYSYVSDSTLRLQELDERLSKVDGQITYDSSLSASDNLIDMIANLENWAGSSLYETVYENGVARDKTAYDVFATGTALAEVNEKALNAQNRLSVIESKNYIDSSTYYNDLDITQRSIMDGEVDRGGGTVSRLGRWVIRDTRWMTVAGAISVCGSISMSRSSQYGGIGYRLNGRDVANTGVHKPGASFCKSTGVTAGDKVEILVHTNGGDTGTYSFSIAYYANDRKLKAIVY